MKEQIIRKSVYDTQVNRDTETWTDYVQKLEALINSGHIIDHTQVLPLDGHNCKWVIIAHEI